MEKSIMKSITLSIEDWEKIYLSLGAFGSYLCDATENSKKYKSMMFELSKKIQKQLEN